MSHSKITWIDNTTYEVLVTSYGNMVNTKPFGIRFNKDKAYLALYPNKTLDNLKNNPKFLIQFTNNPLTYTKALFNKLTQDDYLEDNVLKTASCALTAEAMSFNSKGYSDKYGDTCKTIVASQVNNYRQLDSGIYPISRATNKIMDVLVDCSRLSFSGNNKKEEYRKRINNLEIFVKKTGNNLHLQSINIIKKELLEE